MQFIKNVYIYRVTKQINEDGKVYYLNDTYNELTQVALEMSKNTDDSVTALAESAEDANAGESIDNEDTGSRTANHNIWGKLSGSSQDINSKA